MGASGRATYVTAEGVAVAPELPTVANLKTAAARWLTRCDKPGNNAFVYCVGHGVHDDQSYLLAEDFGANPWKAFDGLVAVEDTYVGTKILKADGVLALFDCCKALDEGLLAQVRGTKGVSLVDVDARALVQHPRALLTSAALGDLATGNASQRTHFCEAFLAAMKGDAGEPTPVPDRWQVTCDSLDLAMRTIADRRGYGAWTVTPHHEFRSFPFFELDGPPEIEVEVGTLPQKAAHYAEIAVRDRAAGERCRHAKPLNPTVRVRLIAQDGYCALASFENGAPWLSAEEPFSVWPRRYPVRIRVPERDTAGEAGQ